MSDDLEKDLDDIMQLVIAAATPEEMENAASIVSSKTNMTFEQAYLFVKTLRVVLENDYVLLDTMMDLIESIMKKLHKSGTFTDEDVEEIKKGNDNDEED